eukprot:1114545-Alexandrium_andersonii.AAC.1
MTTVSVLCVMRSGSFWPFFGTAGPPCRRVSAPPSGCRCTSLCRQLHAHSRSSGSGDRALARGEGRRALAAHL